jgi:tetratricopeptide (TPR) repeat protein
VAQGLTNLGLLRNDVMGPEAAEPLLVEALAMHQRLFPGDHPSTAHNLFSLSALHLRKGDLAAAEPFCIESLAMHRRLYSGDHVGVAISHGNLARVRHGLGRHAEARQDFDAAVAMARQLPGAASVLLDILGRSALARIDTGDFASALPELEDAIALATRLLPPASPKHAAYRQAVERCRAALAADRGK